MILFIEDDLMFVAEVSDFLREHGFSVDVAESGAEALRRIDEASYELCLLDIGLPDCSGFTLCRELRKKYRNSIIILTACDNEDDIVQGLDSGADDYITKPCSLRILLSRIASQLRRKEWFEDKSTQYLQSGDLIIDFSHSMIFRLEKELPVSDTEWKLCAALVENDGRILRREQLLERIWDSRERFIEDNTLSVHMSRLRKKLGLYQNRPYIDTVKGIGYRWNFRVQKIYS